MVDGVAKATANRGRRIGSKSGTKNRSRAGCITCKEKHVRSFGSISSSPMLMTSRSSVMRQSRLAVLVPIKDGSAEVILQLNGLISTSTSISTSRFQNRPGMPPQANSSILRPQFLGDRHYQLQNSQDPTISSPTAPSPSQVFKTFLQ